LGDFSQNIRSFWSLIDSHIGTNKYCMGISLACISLCITLPSTYKVEPMSSFMVSANSLQPCYQANYVFQFKSWEQFFVFVFKGALLKEQLLSVLALHIGDIHFDWWTNNGEPHVFTLCSDNKSEVFQRFISIWSNIFTDVQKW
jgi:hypothetical protein